MILGKKKQNGSKMKRGKSLNLKIENWTHMIFVVILKSLVTGNGPKTRLFRLHGKLVHAVFLIYCIKLHRQKSLKLKLNVFFFSEKLSFKVIWSKGVRNLPKIQCFKFKEKSTHIIFLNFCMKLLHHFSRRTNVISL